MIDRFKYLVSVKFCQFTETDLFNNKYNRLPGIFKLIQGPSQIGSLPVFAYIQRAVSFISIWAFRIFKIKCLYYPENVEALLINRLALERGKYAVI